MSVTNVVEWRRRTGSVWFLRGEPERLANGGAPYMECPLCLGRRTPAGETPCPCCKGKGLCRIGLMRELLAGAFAGILDCDVMERL